MTAASQITPLLGKVFHFTKAQGLSVTPSGGFVTLNTTRKLCSAVPGEAAELCPLPPGCPAGTAAPHLAPAHGAHALDELPGLQLERSAPLHLLVPQLHCSPLLRAAKEAWCHLDGFFTHGNPTNPTSIFLLKSQNIY